MTDKQPPGAGTGGGREKPKLPPRSGDWQSGLKREDPNAYKITASDTVSDFLVSQGDISASSIHDRPEGYEPEQEPRITRDFYHRRVRFSDFLLALMLAVLAFVSIVFTYRGFGHSWDEALYLKPAERAAAWMVGVINLGDDLMLEKEAVDRHWGQFLDGHDPLHPEIAPVPKLLIGAGLTYLKDLAGDPMVAMRLPYAILFGLTVGLIFLIGAQEYGRIGGFAAALMYALMPRVFGHAHIAASETPLAFCVVLTVYCFLVANRFWPVAFFTGIGFGLAVATKVSALMLPIPLMIWGQLYKRRDYASNVFAMAFLAPLVVLAMWPWLWYDGFKRFFAYLLFYMEHQKTAVYYLGRIWGYGGPDAPFYYPLHMIAVVVPVWIMVFVVVGLLRTLLFWRRPATVLFLVMALCWVGLSMLPAAPRYDGERLFFPAFAFLALLGGGGFALLFEGVKRWRRRRHAETAVRETGYVAAIVLLLLTSYGAADLYFSHPNQLNYFNWSVGRARGAYDRGFETSYWGEAVNEDVTEYLNTILEPGDKVKVLALNELAFENLRQWGKLPAKVDFSPDEPPYDYAILQVRQGFMRSRERSLFYSKTPMRVFEAQGVPRIAIYDSSQLGNLFPAPVRDEATTATEASTTSAPGPGQETTTSTTAMTEPTTGPLAVLDPLTTQGEVTTGTAETTGPPVLDLETTPTMHPSMEEGLSTVAQELLSLEDVPTSAPNLYQGEPPSTGTLLTAPPDAFEDE